MDYSELTKAINWYSDLPVQRKKAIYLNGNGYPIIRICSEKIAVHRLLMMYWLKRKLSRKEHVHHKNHNKKCALKENLEVVEASAHLSKHKKGIKFSEEHKRKLSEGIKNAAAASGPVCKKKGCKGRAHGKSLCKKHSEELLHLIDEIQNGMKRDLILERLMELGLTESERGKLFCKMNYKELRAELILSKMKHVVIDDDRM